MSRKELFDLTAHTAFLCAEWIADEEMCRRETSAPHRRAITTDFLQCRGEPFWVAREECARRVSEEFAPPRDGELDELRRERSEHDADHGENHKHRAPVTILIAPPSPHKRHAEEDVSRNGDKARKHHRNSHEEDVAILDM